MFLKLQHIQRLTLLVISLTLVVLSNHSLAKTLTTTAEISKQEYILSKYRNYQKQFVERLLPAIVASNQSIKNDRAHIDFLHRQFIQGYAIPVHDQIWLLQLAETYKIKESSVSEALFTKLLHKVDVIPQELVLSQSAIESAWGKSRFAQQGNNYFGVWCYTKGCGIVPAQRSPGQKQEVRRYANAEESVAHYMLTLNRVRAYKKLRAIRSEQRAKNIQPTGAAMAAGLSKYSAKGWQYVKDVRSVIKKYQFELLQVEPQPELTVTEVPVSE